MWMIPPLPGLTLEHQQRAARQHGGEGRVEAAVVWWRRLQFKPQSLKATYHISVSSVESKRRVNCGNPGQPGVNLHRPTVAERLDHRAEL